MRSRRSISATSVPCRCGAGRGCCRATSERGGLPRRSGQDYAPCTMRFGTYHVFQCPPGQSPERVMAEEIERAEFAEALGFDDVWVPEQHFSPYCLCGDALLMGGHLAAR